MNSIIKQMLSLRTTLTLNDKKHSLREVVQEVILCGLSRAGFFHSAAFYGGTALRIFHGLDRFSEDLDFTLLQPQADFQLKKYLSAVEHELTAYGFHFQVAEKIKSADSAVLSAFAKGNTREHILICYADEVLAHSIAGSELIRIKLEVDTDPPPYAQTERQYGMQPIPFEVCLYNMPSLFAGKIHEVICRPWKNRTKGRDLYDYVFYLANRTPVNLRHLCARLIRSGFVSANANLTLEDIKQILNERFTQIDYAQAKRDVLPFVKNPDALDMWNPVFFKTITAGLVSSSTRVPDT